MFTAMRNYLNIFDIALDADIATLITATTLKAGDKIFWRFSKHLYGTVNAAGTGVTLATA